MTLEISKANDIVREAFKNKTDLGGFPYIYHLYRVADKVKDKHKPIALLHDLLEDCPEWTYQRLLMYFDRWIVDEVAILTKLTEESYEDYIERVKTSPIAIKVKIADLEDNMNLTRIPYTLTEREIKRFKKYHKTWLELIALDK